MKTNQDNQRESFILYKSFFEPIAKFTDEQLGRLFRAIFQWQIDGRSNPEPDIEVAFGFFVNQFRIDNSKYQERCEKNRENAQLRWQMRTDANGCERIQSIAKDADNDNENVNENGLIKEGNSDSKVKKRTMKKPRANIEDEPLELPFSEQEFADTWNELIRQPKWRNKPKSALKLALKQLSEYGADFAVLLMENAITGNYQGVVFPDTPLRYRQWLLKYPEWKRAKMQSTSNNTPGKVITSIDEIYPD